MHINHTFHLKQLISMSQICLGCPLMTPCLKPLLILLVCLTGCGVSQSLHGGEPNPHWAFHPIQKPKPPSNDSPAIDSFVQARLAGSDLAIQEEASPRTLLRRLYFDMTGLPPSFEETQAFSKAPDREIRLPESSRIDSGKPEVRRTMGAALAGSCSVCRYAWIRGQHGAKERLAVPRLRHSCLQRR